MLKIALYRYEQDVHRHVEPGQDGYIVAERPALPGCVSQGKTREEALENIREAIEGIIEACRGQNLPISLPDIVEVSVAA